MAPNGDRTSNRTTTGSVDRTLPGSGPDAFVPLADAAHRIGISYDAARRRIARGTLPAEKRGDRWFVPVTETGPSSAPSPASVTARPDDGPNATGSDPGTLVPHLLEEIAFLRGELAARTEENQRKDQLLALAVQRSPQLPAGEPPQDVPQGRAAGPRRDDEPARVPETLWQPFRRLRPRTGS